MTYLTLSLILVHLITTDCGIELPLPFLNCLVDENKNVNSNEGRGGHDRI
jgi:hypothetical protein